MILYDIKIKAQKEMLLKQFIICVDCIHIADFLFGVKSIHLDLLDGTPPRIARLDLAVGSVLAGGHFWRLLMMSFPVLFPGRSTSATALGGIKLSGEPSTNKP